jgi:hypothetical protein
MSKILLHFCSLRDETNVICTEILAQQKHIFPLFPVYPYIKLSLKYMQFQIILYLNTICVTKSLLKLVNNQILNLKRENLQPVILQVRLRHILLEFCFSSRSEKSKHKKDEARVVGASG